ncbi:MAG TPA: DUF4337 domain-containing protein [Bryobacteraceae bacterium]|nr:DUF4337 domain-containing protein [Bryobacteraceae bacterium]
MSTSEELHEHAEHAAHSNEPFNKRVAATMAIIAAVLAVVGVLGQVSVTEELLLQQKASDQWAYYQAKSIRRYESEVARDLFGALKQSDSSQTYQKNADRYRDDQAEIQKKAGELEAESRTSGRRAQRYHFGEVFIEIAIVLASLAILAHREAIYWLAVLSAALGSAIALSVLLVH